MINSIKPERDRSGFMRSIYFLFAEDESVMLRSGNYSRNCRKNHYDGEREVGRTMKYGQSNKSHQFNHYETNEMKVVFGYNMSGYFHKTEKANTIISTWKI